VGPTTEELESVKELIHFDHTYLKASAKDDEACHPAVTLVDQLDEIQELLLLQNTATEPADIVSKESTHKQEFYVSPTNTWSTSSDSGYSDYDASSPMSDGSGLGEDPWEESFTELFPTLL